jgi:hypothetical protein
VTILSLVVAVAAIVSTGSATVRALGPGGGDPFERTLRGLLAIAFGLGIWSGTYAVARFVGAASGLLVLDVVLATAGVVVLARHRASPLVPARQLPPGPFWLGAALVVAALLVAAIFATVTAGAPEGVDDAWIMWTLRARFLARDPDLHHAFSDAAPLWHADYPLLLPGLIAQGWRVLGGESGAVPIVVAATFTSLVVATLVAAVGAERGGASGFASGLAVLGAPIVTFVGAAQIADVPLGAFLLAGCICLARAVPRPEDRGPAALAGLALSLACWTKNEGAIHLIAFALVLATLRRRRQLIAFGLGALPVLLLLAWFKLAYAPRNDIVSGIGAGSAVSRVVEAGRYREIGKALVLEPYAIHHWSFFPAVLPLLVVALRRRRRAAAWSSGGVVALALAIAWAGILLTYLLTPYDTRWHLASSLDRLVTQSWPSLVLATFLALPPLAAAPPVSVPATGRLS